MINVLFTTPCGKFIEAKLPAIPAVGNKVSGVEYFSPLTVSKVTFRADDPTVVIELSNDD